MFTPRAARWLTATVAVVASTCCAASATAARFVGTGTHKWAIVLCDFSDQGPPAATATQAYDQAYYQALFANAGGLGEADYWSNVSFGQLSLAGTTVTNWAPAKNPADTSKSLTRGQWQTLTAPFNRGGGDPRYDKIIACADGASGIDFSQFWGVAAIFPEARSTTSAAINSSATTVTLSTTQNFPTSPPFTMGINDGSANNGEDVTVTAINGNTFTITRGGSPQAHAAGANVGVDGDLGGVGTGQLGGTPIKGTNYTIATIVLPHQIDLTGGSHEMGHGHGYNHTRSLTGSVTDYGDGYDLMSQYWCQGPQFSANPGANNFDPTGGTDFGGTGSLYDYVLCAVDRNAKGPGLDAINLDLQGWIPTAPTDWHFYRGASQSTIKLHTLSDPGALTTAAPPAQFLEARLPASVTIQNAGTGPTIPPTCSPAPNTCTTSQYYTLEYREKSGWDRGFPASAVMLHLFGGDSYSYWLDKSPSGQTVGHGGLLYAGDDYADPANNTFLAVNSLNADRTATVTLGPSKLTANLALSGATSGDFNDQVTLAADLTVGGAPVPAQPVALSVGSQACNPVPVTNTSGHVSCTITLSQHPGATTVDASFTGDAVYNQATASTGFTINQEQSQVTYTGPLTADYHDAFTASARLFDPDGGAPIAGKPITFTLGTGDTCSANTDGGGVASCSITPTQAAGSYNIVASFGPDTDYVSSADTKGFAITKEETSLSYDGPFKVANDFPATLKATLTEDGTTAPVPSGQTITFTLGSGATQQTCQGMTDAAGRAQCTIASVQQPDSASMTVPVAASFGSDAYYLASSASATVKLLYYTGRAYGLSDRVLLFSNSPFSDTGELRTAARSQTDRSTVSASFTAGSAYLLKTSATTGGGTSSSQASVASVSITPPFLPGVHATAVSASSQSTCAGASGSSTLTKLTVGGVTIPVSNLAPNTTYRVGALKITLNEQLPVPGADQGLIVNALHIVYPGALEFVFSSAKSDIHNC